MNKKERDKKERRVVSARAWAQQKDSGGGGSYNMPEGLSFWKPSEGTAFISIVPYEIVTEGKNPLRIDGEPLPVGSLFHVRTVYNHWVPAPGGNQCYNCGKTFGVPCAVCDHQRRLARDPDEDEDVVKSLAVKTRQLYLIYDHNDVEKGLQLWDVSPFAFGDLLKERIEDNEAYDMFADPEEGLALKVKLKKTAFGKGGTFLKAVIIDFVPRKKALPEDVINHGIDLDELPKEVPYDEVKGVLLGVVEEKEDEDEEEEEAPPSKNGKAKHTEQFECDAGDTVSFEYKGKTRTGTVKRVRAKDNLVEVLCEDRSVPYSVSLDDPSLEMAEPEEPDEDEDEGDEEEEEEAPVAKKKATAKAAAGKKSSKAEEEDEEEEEDDDDDAWDDD